MRQAILTVALALLCVVPVAAQVFQIPRPDNTPPKVPKYLLVLRYWGSVQSGYEMGWGWVYLTETYNTLDEVKAEMERNCGWQPRSVVGCWRLTDDRAVKITMREVKHEAQDTVRVREWTETIWSVTE